MSDSRGSALVTGAAGGLGSAIAIQLAEAGFRVFAADVVTEGLRRFEGVKHVHTLSMDVTDDSQVREGVASVLDSSGRIDLLVNNAALPQAGVIETTPIETIRRLFDVNVLGYARLQAAVLPHMRSRGAGRIINICSAIGKVPMPGFGWYAATKHAIEGMSDALRMEVAALGVRVTIIEPGLIATPFVSRQSDSINHVPHDADYARLERYAAKFGMNGQGATPDEIARAVVRVATMAKPPIRLALPASARTLILARRLMGDRFLFNSLLRGLKLK